MDFFLFVRSKSYRELKQYDKYVTSMNEALLSSDTPILKSLLFQVNFDKELEIYFETSLMCLLNSIEMHLSQVYFKSWVQSVIEWLHKNKYPLDTLKTLNFTLRKHSNVSFEHILTIEDEFCPNKTGVRPSTNKQKTEWYKKLKTKISSETRTNVKMSWLNGESGEKVTRYMKDNFVNILFGLDGKPVLNYDLTQRTGKKHVVVLRDKHGKRLVYLKFYPDYPLRQQAVDELCFRLSGHGLISSLVKLTHDKQPHIVYPVLFSEPMGADDVRPTLHDNLFKVEEIEANFDMSLFSWKFLETFILRPREEKPDNVAVNVEPSSSKYFYASLDNDVTFGHRRYTCEQPNVYSIVYLSDLMWQPCSTSVASALLFMDIEKLFYEWINEFKETNQYLFGNEVRCLFNLEEVASIKRLIGSEYMGKSISCNLDACFTDADLIGVFNRLIKVKHILQQRTTSIFKLDKESKRQILLAENQSHFDLLQQLDTFDYGHYTRVNNENSIGDDYQTRFQKLPGFDRNFNTTHQDNENETVIISSKAVNEPITAYRLIKSKLGREKIMRIKTLASLDDQLKVLAYYTSSLSSSLNDFMNMDQREKSIFFKNVNWNLLSPQIQRDIFNLLSTDDIDIAQLCFVDLTLLNDDTLAKISRQQKNSLEKISIKNCANLTSNLFANRNEFQVKSLFLTELNQFVTIKAQTFNVMYLYLYELSKLERFEIEWDGSKLKEIYIETCSSLVLLNLNLMQLKLLTLKDVDSERLTLKYNLRSIEHTDENTVEHKEEKEFVFRNLIDRQINIRVWRVKRSFFAFDRESSKRTIKFEMNEDKNRYDLNFRIGNLLSPAIAYNNKGFALNGLKQYEEAIKCYDEAIRLDTKYAAAYTNKGAALSELKQYEEAIKCYDEAIRLDTKYAAAYNNKGIALRNLKQYEEAIKCLDEAIRLDTKYAAAYNNKGFALSELKQYEEAIKCYDKSIKLDPNNAAAYNNKGNALYEIKQYEEAIKCYDEAIRLDPNAATTYNNKGFALIDLKQYEEAIKCYDEAIRLDPNAATTYNNKGFALIDLKQYEEAIECLDEAIRLDTKYAAAYKNKGFALSELKQYEEAIKCYDKSIELDPKHASAYNNKGDAWRNLKEYEKAIECYDKRIKLRPKDAVAYFNKGFALNKLNQYKKAIECCDKSIKLDRNNAAAYDTKGEALNVLNQHEEAIKCLDEAIRLDPNNANAYYHKELALNGFQEKDQSLGFSGYEHIFLDSSKKYKPKEKMNSNDAHFFQFTFSATDAKSNL
jgi:tetratricopeptide (TPR) repeat protein